MTGVLLSLPFTGRWKVQNSPARRVPSHGVDIFGERYAIDFVAVDERGRTASRNDWRTWLATEPPDRYVGFGAPLLSPCNGVVAAVHDGEPDHEGRRSQLALAGYLLGQASRMRQGAAAIAGNSVIIALDEGEGFVALVHLRQGSVTVAPGDRVEVGHPLAAVGNSGNSTEPHLHLQVMDNVDYAVAAGIPLAFRDYVEWPRGARSPEFTTSGVPGEGSIVEPWAAEST